MQRRRAVATNCVGVHAAIDLQTGAAAGHAAGNFIEQQLHAFHRHVLEDWIVKVKREFLGEALRIEVGVEGDIGARKVIGELAAGQPQPLQPLRMVNNESAIKADGFPFEKIGKRIVGAGRIGKRTHRPRRAATAGHEAARQVKAAGEILIGIAFKPQAQANARPVAVHGAFLEETLTTDSHVSAPAETAECRFQRAKFFLLILRGKRGIGGVGLHVLHVTLYLTHGGVALVGSLLRRNGFVLRL